MTKIYRSECNISKKFSE